jgi:hypothetical protein
MNSGLKVRVRGDSCGKGRKVGWKTRGKVGGFVKGEPEVRVEERQWQEDHGCW